MRGYGVRIQRIEAYSAGKASDMQFGLEPSGLMGAWNSSSVGDDRWYSAAGLSGVVSRPLRLDRDSGGLTR